MGPERWQKIEQTYHAVAALPREERAPWLERECEGDAELRAEVERMLAVDSGGIGFLETPAMEVAARALAEAAPLRTGSRFGPYEIGGLLGAGGMGEVYRARDPRLNRTVAIKVLPAIGADDPGRRRRLLQEARAASALKHPNIVTIYDILSEGGRDALVMEYVAGRTLDEKLAGRSLPLGEALHYAIQIAGALATAHAAGIVHRDVKPGNIMVTGEEAGPGTRTGTVTVLDFGLAKFPETEGGPVGNLATGEGRIFGTVAYMSPEQAEGRRVDTRSDTFSFGLVLYEMLTGRKAFLRDTTTSTLAAILRDEFAPAPGIPERLRMVLARCLRKEPDKRAQSMADIKVLLEEIREELETPPAGSRGTFRHWKTWPIAAALLVVLAAVGWLVFARSGYKVEAVTVRPVTSYPGLATAPSFSPDGNQVAFSWDGEKQDNSDIYVKLVDSPAALRLTTNAAPDVLPAWSPDGRQIAFLRASGPKSRELLLVSPLGGAERKLAELSQGVNPAQWWTAPAWTPDSKFLAVRDGSAIVLISVESGERRKLTSPPENWNGDWQAAFSPDGKTLAFARIRNGPMQDVFVAPVSDAAKVRQLTHDSIGIGGLAWTNDGKEIVFASSRGGDQSLWRISVSGGAPELVTAAGTSASHPAIARQGQRAAFVRSTIRKSFWRLELGPDGVRGSPVKLVTSSRNDSNPMVSPDGRQIAFTSNRSGRPELWLCDSEGGNAVQLTSVGFARNAYWSPDGKSIVFDARPGERNLLFVIAAGGGAPRPLSSDEGYYPSWSRDGRWIYFYGRMSGAIEAWKVPAAGGTAIQLTKRGGGPGIESMDGRYFYYHKFQEIWRVPVEGGEETPVVREQTNFMNLWALGGEGLYFTVPVEAAHQTSLNVFGFERGQSRRIAVLNQPFPGLGGRLSLSADGRWLLYDQYDRNESDILLMEKFR